MMRIPDKLTFFEGEIAWPKISIITPNYNQAKFLEATILSVINQQYPNLEYIIIDANSTDGSVEIIKKYAAHLSFWVSEPDKGLYDALQKGFEKSTGDIMGWLNSDDLLHSNALFSVAELLKLKGVEWIQGQPTIFDEAGRTIKVEPQQQWSKYRFLLSDYKWIQQESTFWTRALWNKAGAYINTQYKLAGDLELWNRFFKQAKLFTPACLIGGFRVRKSGQLSIEGMDEYLMEARAILKENIDSPEEEMVIKKIQRINTSIRFLKRTRLLNVAFLNNRLIRIKVALYDFPPDICFSNEHQYFLIP